MLEGNQQRHYLQYATLSRFLVHPVERHLLIIFILAFNITEDEVSLQKAITSYYQLCSLAHHFQLSDVLDKLVHALCQSTTLAQQAHRIGVKPSPYYQSNTELASYEDQTAERSENMDRSKSATRSDFISRYSRDFRAQVATIVAFRIVDEFGNCIRGAWGQV
jgi:Sec7-like guanine-nucleotide exchange factor